MMGRGMKKDACAPKNDTPCTFCVLCCPSHIRNGMVVPKLANHEFTRLVFFLHVATKLGHLRLLFIKCGIVPRKQADTQLSFSKPTLPPERRWFLSHTAVSVVAHDGVRSPMVAVMRRGDDAGLSLTRPELHSIHWSRKVVSCGFERKITREREKVQN